MSYQDDLKSAWQDHLLPRDADAPTVISAFAGCGGSSLGYSMAGFKELLAVEFDAQQMESFRANMPNVDTYFGDIKKLSVDECLDLAGIEPGRLDVFDGSPPCQGFSTAGNRNIDDSRNSLFREYARLLRGIQPKAFVMENVKGMVKGKMKLIFSECLRELKDCRYKVSARVLDAKYFGVPQSRQRIIFIGVRDDIDRDVSHPNAEAFPITVKGAWAGLKEELPEYVVIPRKAQTDWERSNQGDPVGGYSSNRKLVYNKPAHSLCKDKRQYHPLEPRTLTVTELKRLCSFPDEYIFSSPESAVNGCGNCVPPFMIRSIARHIKNEILN